MFTVIISDGFVFKFNTQTGETWFILNTPQGPCWSPVGGPVPAVPFNPGVTEGGPVPAGVGGTTPIRQAI